MGWQGLDQYRGQLLRETEAEFGVLIRAQKKLVGLELLTQVTQRTPVNIGEARAGWHFSASAPTDTDVQGSEPETKLAGLVDEAAPEAPIYLQNNVEHMVVIDQGLYEHDTPPGGSEARHVPATSRDTVRGKVLVVGGFHVSAPKGVAGPAADQVAADFGLERTQEN